jgi:hypothetical protein
MTPPLPTIYSAAWRAAVVLFTLQISFNSTLRYITHSQAAPEPILANAYATPFLVLHVFAAMVSLLVGAARGVPAAV